MKVSIVERGEVGTRDATDQGTEHNSRVPKRRGGKCCEPAGQGEREWKRVQGRWAASCWGDRRGGKRAAGYHAMRHVRVTSRGRSREHRVLSITCPVTRSPLHPPSLSSHSVTVSLSLSAATPRRPLVLLSFLIATTPFERVCARTHELARSHARTDYAPNAYLFLPFPSFLPDVIILKMTFCDCLLISHAFYDDPSTSKTAIIELCAFFHRI